MLLFKNRRDTRVSWRVGTGPGSWVDYEAEPGEFAIIPEGYRDQAKREGFTPIDELPEDERPEIHVAKQRHALGKTQKKTFAEDEDGERLERAMPSKPLAGVSVSPTRPTPPPAPPRPSDRPQIDFSRAPADGPMALANVPELPALPPPPEEPPAAPAVALTAKATLAGDMGVEDAAGVPPEGAGMPAPPSERTTAPETPKAKDKAKK